MSILVCGVYLGDIGLALAALAKELPPHVTGIDIGALLPQGEETDAIRGEVEKVLSGSPDPESLPPALLRMILDRAIDRGKFLSATRCLETLGEKDDCVRQYIDRGESAIREGKIKESARAFVIAANLDLNEGSPLFQYSGSALHENCTTSQERCITRLPIDDAILGALRYLLASGQVVGAMENLSPEQRKALLPFIAHERDPNATAFLASCKTAHSDLEETTSGLVAHLTTTTKHVEHVVGRFAESIEKIRPREGDTTGIIDRLKRSTASLRKEFVEAPDLVPNWQMRRLRRRFEHLIESKDEMEEAQETLKKSGSLQETVFRPILELIDELVDKGILEDIDTAEQRLVSTQVTMLGRQVHSQEHWQYIRELAFKYPVSPLMCCLKRINDRWMVVPLWESHLARVLRDHLEKQVAASS